MDPDEDFAIVPKEKRQSVEDTAKHLPETLGAGLRAGWRVVCPYVSREAGPTSSELGQHTEEILLELGYDWEKITEMKRDGALP